MLVWNDFWESTQDYNIEAQDPQLFLKNVADVISRFRNHPSIAALVRTQRRRTPAHHQ